MHVMHSIAIDMVQYDYTPKSKRQVWVYSTVSEMVYMLLFSSLALRDRRTLIKIVMCPDYHTNFFTDIGQEQRRCFTFFLGGLERQIVNS
jgi:hypothetical protein